MTQNIFCLLNYVVNRLIVDPIHQLNVNRSRFYAIFYSSSVKHAPNNYMLIIGTIHSSSMQHFIPLCYILLQYVSAQNLARNPCVSYEATR